jgi:hypothetical protein
MSVDFPYREARRSGLVAAMGSCGSVPLTHLSR